MMSFKGNKKKIFGTVLWLLLLGNTSLGQEIAIGDSVVIKKLDEIVVNLPRKVTASSSNITRSLIEEKSTTSSIPYLIEEQPSVVASGENGSVGNSSFRIRGIDITRITVNINGIPLNDAESQMVYWVNIPNLGGMAQSIQLQRGAACADGGKASSGGAMNIVTLNTHPVPYGEASLGLGSWNTRQESFLAGTGLNDKGWGFDVGYNGLTSDGFVRNGYCNHQSLFATGGYYGRNTIVKGLMILGRQHTGITWDGASAEELDLDPRHNSAGQYRDTSGNVFYYDNQSDNYFQRRYQIAFNHLFKNEKTAMNLVGDLTRGDGYYEEYHDDVTAQTFGLDHYIDNILSDFIIQRKMKNYAATERGDIQFWSPNWKLELGETFLHYDGDQFGHVIWAQEDRSVSDDNPFEWYRNKGIKNDLLGYLRGSYRNDLLVGEVQYRWVDYSIVGPDYDYVSGMDSLLFHERYNFLNSKLGINRTHSLPKGSDKIYLMAGFTNREPTRADIIGALKTGDSVSAEHLLDFEMGYLCRLQRFAFSANGYAMLYRDQLSASGELNEGGYSIMINVPKSYRIGLELEGVCKINNQWNVDGNISLSRNRIIDYIYAGNSLGNTDLAFSPSVVGALMVHYRPSDDWHLQLIGKYVGQQYCDNTSRIEMLQDDYFLLNASLQKEWDWNQGSLSSMMDEKKLILQLAVNNILNHTYRLSAWAADYGNGDIYRGYYQQPGINATLRITFKF